MSIIRTKKSRNYTTVNNQCFQDENISARAKGIFAYIMTLPDDWKLYKKELYKHFKEGRNAIDTAFKELEDAGYIHKEANYENGKLNGWNFTVFESPQTSQDSELQVSSKSENPQLPKTDDKPKTKVTKKDSKECKSMKGKKQYAEFVFFTEDEYEKLKKKFPTQYDLDLGVEKLNNYKGAEGKKYESDYHAMLKWVFDAVRLDAQKAGVPFGTVSENDLFGDL